MDRGGICVLAIAALVAACGQPDETSVAPTVAPDPAPIAPPVAPPPPVTEPARTRADFAPDLELPETMLGTSATHDEILAALARVNPVRIKPVGTSAVVLRLTIEDESYAAFRPEQLARPRGHFAELSAYRLSRLLGMDNVPPVIIRAIPRDLIEDRWDDRYADDLAVALGEMVARPEGSRDARVNGAMIYWIPEMRQVGLDDDDNRARILTALRVDAEIPAGKAEFLRDLSTLIAFDYLIANYDRWSGHNAKGTIAGHRIFVRDHDQAFGTPLPVGVETRLLADVEQVERFSIGFVERLRRLDVIAVRAELARDDSGAEALGAAQIRDLMERRQTLLSYIDALIDEHGREHVLTFP